MNWFTRIACGRGMRVDRAGLLRLLPLLLWVLYYPSPSQLAAQVPTAAAVSFGPVMTPFETIAANAPYRVCAITSLSVPCSTAGVSLFSDPNLTQPLPNPSAANTQGIISFFVAQGNYVMQVTPLPGETYIYNFILSAGGGGGSVGPGTVGFIPKFATSTTVNNSHIDDGATTASTITATEPVVIAVSGGAAGSIKFGQGTAPSFTSGNGYIFSDASGNMMSNDNATGSGHICNSVNGQCPTGMSGMTATQVPIAATATTVTSSKPLAGAGAGITTGPTSSTSGHCAQFTGTAGQIADSGGACGGGGSYPTPVTVSGTNVTELDLTGCITSSNRDYDIRFSQITWTAGTAVTAFIQFSSDNGSTWDQTSDYFYARSFVQMNGGSVGTTPNQTSGGIVPSLSSGNTSNSGDIIDTHMTLYFPMNTTGTKMGKIETQINAASGGPLVFDMDGGWWYTGTSAVNAVRLLTSGTFTGQATCQPLPQ